MATLTDAVDSWAVEAFNSGEYSPQQHARLAAAVLAGFVPIVGEICDGKITFYAGANLAK